MSIDYQLLIALSGVFLGAFTALTIGLLIINSRRESRYREEIGRAELSYVRDSLEAKIAQLNRELTSNEDRWLEVNHLLVSAQNNKLTSTSKSSNRFWDQFAFADIDFEVDPSLVFVLTPFNSSENDTYLAIKRVCHSLGLKAVRGDEEHAEGDILKHILRQMLKARLIIANVGSRNPNVFYELGIAQAIGKPTLLVASHQSEIPFDLQSRRIILFSDIRELEDQLPRFLVTQFSN
ncbi:hypothetical protein [Pseudovibrio sp. JE062]|uniref:hypothetical protein n=1 Tax=Pseudovibrio sp. JE062 TaxID=439495 RepID=UPI0006801366|nr:hypothetical protein [Pseudovibrio sp. JE062]